MTDQDEFRDRVFAYLDATAARWKALDAAFDIAFDISEPGEPFDGSNIELLAIFVGDWMEKQR